MWFHIRNESQFVSTMAVLMHYSAHVIQKKHKDCYCQPGMSEGKIPGRYIDKKGKQ